MERHFQSLPIRNSICNLYPHLFSFKTQSHPSIPSLISSLPPQPSYLQKVREGHSWFPQAAEVPGSGNPELRQVIRLRDLPVSVWKCPAFCTLRCSCSCCGQYIRRGLEPRQRAMLVAVENDPHLAPLLHATFLLLSPSFQLLNFLIFTIWKEDQDPKGPRGKFVVPLCYILFHFLPLNSPKLLFFQIFLTHMFSFRFRGTHFSFLAQWAPRIRTYDPAFSGGFAIRLAQLWPSFHSEIKVNQALKTMGKEERG